MPRYKSMPKVAAVSFTLIVLLCGIATALAGDSEDKEKQESAVERGRYLVQMSGCNDCHTAGYLLNEGKVPENDWLEGNPLGWRGDWGTTYANNLRLFAAGMSQDEWVKMARELKRRPPMPWFAMNKMHEKDLVAIYQFLRYLGPAGEPAPAGLPPGVEPQGPYAQFPTAPKGDSQ